MPFAKKSLGLPATPFRKGRIRQDPSLVQDDGGERENKRMIPPFLKEVPRGRRILSREGK